MKRILILILFFFVTLPSEIGVVSDDNQQLEVHFLDVGQGDSTLVILPNKKVILIDGGPIESGDNVMEVLQQLHIKKIDLLVATHPDIDHIGGLLTVLKKVKVKNVLDSGRNYDTHTYQSYINIIKKKDIPLKKAKEGKFVHLDSSVNIQILNDAKEKDENNESSIVLKISYKKADVLLTGDADVFVEEQMIAKKYNLGADILKVGHHGSYTSTSPRFLEIVRPKYAIISYAKSNEYGHPHKRVLERLKVQQVKVLRTADVGMISIHTDGEYLTVGNGEKVLLSNDE